MSLLLLLSQSTSSATGTASIAEGIDTPAITGSVSATAAGTVTEQADLTTASGSISASASGAISEGSDSVSSAGVISASASGSIVEGSDSSSATGAISASGALSSTEGTDAVAAPSSVYSAPSALDGAIGEVIGLPIGGGYVSAAISSTGAVSLAEGLESVSGSATVSAAATLAVTESADITVASGAISEAGSVSVTEQADAVSSAGSLSASGSVAVSEALDVPNGTGGTSATGSGSAVEGPDYSQFAATSYSSLPAAVPGAIGYAAIGAESIVGGFVSTAYGSITEALDSVSVSGAVSATATASIAETADIGSLAAYVATFIYAPGAIGSAPIGSSIGGGYTVTIPLGPQIAAAPIGFGPVGGSYVVGNPFTIGTVSAVESVDSAAASANAFVPGSGISIPAAIAGGAIVGQIVLPNYAAPQEGLDSVQASGSVIENGAVAATEGGDSVQASGVVLQYVAAVLGAIGSTPIGLPIAGNQVIQPSQGKQPAGDDSRRRKHGVRHGNKLLVFDTAEEAREAQRRIDAENAPKPVPKKPKRVEAQAKKPAPIPSAVIELGRLQALAMHYDVMREVREAAARMEYERLVAMHIDLMRRDEERREQERRREEEEIAALLLMMG